MTTFITFTTDPNRLARRLDALAAACRRPTAFGDFARVATVNAPPRDPASADAHDPTRGRSRDDAAQDAERLAAALRGSSAEGGGTLVASAAACVGERYLAYFACGRYDAMPYDFRPYDAGVVTADSPDALADLITAYALRRDEPLPPALADLAALAGERDRDASPVLDLDMGELYAWDTPRIAVVGTAPIADPPTPA